MSNDAPSAPLYFEDMPVGWRISTASISIDSDMIKEFASRFDPQPFHLDETAAAESFFGGLVASGWHTAAITMRLLVGALPIQGGVIGAGGEVTWPRATRPGDELTVECEVVAATPSRSRPERGMVTIRSETRNQRGEVVQVMTARLVVQRRSGSAAGVAS